MGLCSSQIEPFVCTIHTCSPNFPLNLVFQASLFHNALHLAVTATERVVQPVKAGVAHVALRGELSPLSQNALVQKQHAESQGFSRDDLFLVLLLNLQRDSGRSGGHLSAGSGLQAISIMMPFTTELCMKLG